MASPNDSLIFPVHFDMDKAVKNAEDIFKGKEKELNKMFTANINLKISPKSIENLEDVQKRLKEIRLQPVTPETRNAIRVLVKELEGLAKILEKVDRLNAQSSKNAATANATNAMEAQRRARTAQINAKTDSDELLNAERLRQAKARAVRAELDLQRAQERTTRTTSNQTKAFHSQANMLNGLKQTMGAYVSLLGAKTLANNIREVTQEFELQRVALSAILQDKQKADELFNQVVQLAVKSPFQIKEMVGFTKQLAAYRINTEDLFDTTKRLADVSAGLGVEMSRLILAYGQVSAASVLRGQEVRQFTEAGIPLIQLLAEKFTELNGEMTTTGDVFQLISERAVPFEMVKEVFEDMTNAGGIFYDMQAKQADTLYGIYSNLGDAWDVAFNEIGQENLGLMKGLGETLTAMGENWRTLESILVTLVGTYGVYRIAMAMATRETLALTAAKRYEIMFDSIQMGQSPKLITAILGEARAKKIALINANLLNAAKTRLAMSNNILTRSFHRLSVAMLSNPYVMLATAIGAAGLAIYRFITYESDLDRMYKKIEKSSAELKQGADASVLSLNILTNKLKNATRGSRDYSNIIKEINSRYGKFLPEQLKVSQSYDDIARAISGVTAALNEKARSEALSSGVNEVQSNYKKVLSDAQQEAIDKLSGSDFFGRGLGISKEAATEIWGNIMTTLSENPELYKGLGNMYDLANREILRALSSSGVGEDEADKLLGFFNRRFGGIRDEIRSVSSALNDLPKNIDRVEQSVTSTFGRKSLDPMSKSVKEINDEFDKYRKNLSGMEMKEDTFNIALIELEKEELTKLIEIYAKYDQFDLITSTQQKLKDLSGLSRGWRNIVTNIVNSNKILYSKFRPTEDENSLFSYADTLSKKYKEVGEQIKRLNGENGKLGLNVDDDGRALEFLKNDLVAIETIAKQLNIDLSVDDKKTGGSKKDPRVESLESEIKLIKEVHSRYQELSKSLTEKDARAEIEKTYGSIKPASLKFAFNDEELKEQYREFMAKMKALGVKDAITQKYKLELSDIDFKRFQDSLKAKIKKLGDDLEKQQKANKFFEKIIGAGMDAQIAASITMSLYGFDSSNIRQTMISSLEEGMGGIKLDLTPEGTIDFSKVAEKIKANELLSPDLKDAYLDLANSIRDNDAETIESLYSNLSKYSEYEQRRMDIVNKANDERKKIQSSAVTESMKGDLLSQSRKKESKDLATLEYDMFKESDLYATMFENLDKVSTASLDAIRSKLDAFKQSNIENLDPTQIRELTRSFEKVDEQFRARNPFQALINGISEYRSKAKEAEEANKSIADINTRLSGARADVSMAKEMSAVAKAKGQDSKVWDDSVASSEKLIKQLEEQLGIQLKITNESKRTKDALAEGALGVSDKLGGIDSSIGAFGDTLSLLGVDMDSELGATFGDLQNVIGGAAEAAGGFGKVMKGDLSGIGDMISGTGKQIQGFVGIFTGINRKVAKANKEIKKQAEIIKELQKEYQKLEKSMDDLMGVDWAQNNADQIINLEAQYKATQKQLEAEKSKGKKADKDKMDEYEQQMQEMQDRIVERQKAFAEQLLGTNVGDAARSFASAWLDAKLSFEDTTKAIEDRMRDMMKNMLIEAILGKVIQEYVNKMFEDVGDIWDRQEEFKRETGDRMLEADKKWLMDNQGKWFARSGINAIDMFDQAQAKKLVLANDIYTNEMIRALTDAGIATREILSPNKEKIENLVNGISGNASDLNDILTAVFDGMDLSGLMDFKDTSLTGISKAVGSLSEETALTLAAAANSSLYYNIGQYNELVMIHEILTRWDAERSVAIQGTDTSSGVSGLIAVQNLALDELRKANISLEDIMESNREIQEFFVSLTSPLGSRSGTRAINVNI